MEKATKTVAAWLTEGIFIMVSVLLGFAVTQYGADRADRALASKALASLQSELEFNLAMVEPYVDFHRAHLEQLRKTDAVAGEVSGYQLFLKLRPALPKDALADVPLIRRAAWDAASSSGALRLIDYDLIAHLSAIYQMQDHLGDAIARVPIASKEFFDPRDRLATIRQTEAALGEMMWAEQSLVELYKKELPAIRAAAVK
jgi:hypothetical protein